MREAIADAGPTDRVPPFRFSARMRVEIADTDAGGVVYYGRYATLVDRAVLAWRRHLGVPAMGPAGHLFVVTAMQVDYRAPARVDDLVEALVRASALRRASHSMEVRLERLDEAAPVHLADARLVIGGVRAYGGRPTRVPQDLLARIAAFEGLATPA